MRCAWCGRAVHSEDGYRLREATAGRAAAFCRLEHVIPWTIRGARWDEPVEAGEADGETAEGVERCAHCEALLGEDRLMLVRHRGEHRIADGFCSIDHLAAWAKAGGRWR